MYSFILPRLQAALWTLFSIIPKELTSYSLSNQVIPDSARRAVSFASGGFTLHGFMVTPAVQKTSYMILYFHGNKESIEQYWDRMEIFYQAGIPVFIFDYRGFGMSNGTSSEESMMEDARSAVTLVQSYPQAQQGLVLYGYSQDVFLQFILRKSLTPSRTSIQGTRL
ncbi:MAG: alpha/beta hydrolase [Ignavibacteria bacterium]|nr:alpha/beta hydrolase [Ignavibacteria bacterium]